LYAGAIIISKALPVWLAYFGLILAVTAVILLASGFVLVDLHGFRYFIFGFVAWVVAVGFFLVKSPKSVG
jgi:hypothetical protein